MIPRAAINDAITQAAALCGGPAGPRRVWSNRLPQKGADLPRIVWTVQGTNWFGSHDPGRGPALTTIELACEAKTDDDADAVAAQAVDALVERPDDGVLQGFRVPDSSDDPEPPQEGAELGFSRVRVRLMVAHS